MKLDSDHHAVGLDSLMVQGEAAPKNPGGVAPLSATLRANKPLNHLNSSERTYPFVLNKTPENEDVTVTSLNGPTTVPVRKMEHLSRVRTANFGITTMDSPFVVSGDHETTFVIEKPHFVLCGLPVSGSKEIDHHLYVSEARVGNFKTSARALYQARRGPRSSKALSDPAFAHPEKELINFNTNLTETVDESGKKSVPPIPPTTPVNYSHHLASLKPRTAIGMRTFEGGGQKFHGSIPSGEAESKYVPNDLIKHRKMTLLRREQTSDSIELHREHSSVSTRSGKSVETVTESVVTNSLTVTTGKGAKIVSKSLSKSAKVNYNNPYRNTKFKERLALNGHTKRIEFNSLDSYLKYQKQHHNNERHIFTPRSVLRVPKPCSDTFLLQMMYDLNRPKTRKSSAKYSDIAVTQDLEEFVQTRTSSSLSKTQSNIDKFMGKSSVTSAKSAKSGKSTRSAKSMMDAGAIEEEETWAEEIIPDTEDQKADIENKLQ